jgi:hypothetical protein
LKEEKEGREREGEGEERRVRTGLVDLVILCIHGLIFRICDVDIFVCCGDRQDGGGVIEQVHPGAHSWHHTLSFILFCTEEHPTPAAPPLSVRGLKTGAVTIEIIHVRSCCGKGGKRRDDGVDGAAGACVCGGAVPVFHVFFLVLALLHIHSCDG